MPPGLQVQLAIDGDSLRVEKIEEAVQLYLKAYGKQFSGEHGGYKKSLHLGRFVNYLKEQGHSLRLEDLALSDGQAFLDSLSHAYHGTSMSPQTKKRYKCALRSFSRFLHNNGLLPEDVLFMVRQ